MKNLGPIGYGTMGIGGKYTKATEDDKSYSEIFKILSSQKKPVLIDTAEIYGNGFCEEIIGKLIQEYGHSNFFICTKFAPTSVTRDQIKKSFHESLKRLKVDQIDLFQSHWPVAEEYEVETIKAFSDLMSAGLVKNIGLSNVTISQLKRMEEIASVYKLNLESIQVEMSIFEPYAMHNIIPYAKSKGYSILSYSPLGKGQLNLKLDNEDKQHIERLTLKYSVSESSLWLAWIINTTGTIPIPMTSNIEHLKKNLGSQNIVLTKEDCDLMAKIYSPKYAEIEMKLVIPGSSHHGGIIKNIDEAKENTLNLNPSPKKLSIQYLKGDEMLKPIKVRFCPLKDKFEIIEGQLRYWAWRLAFGEKSTVPSYIYD
jgi:aryl-alcohol dehydrogenase-like predicted oxidoreductase